MAATGFVVVVENGNVVVVVVVAGARRMLGLILSPNTPDSPVNNPEFSGLVVLQTPSAGTKVAAGTAVTVQLGVYTGAPATTTTTTATFPFSTTTTVPFPTTDGPSDGAGDIAR